jgi:hypothetical protein
MGPKKSDPNKRLITITVILLSCTQCIFYFINVFVAKLGSTAGKFGEVEGGGEEERE